MAGDEPVTLGEVNRNVERLTQSVDSLRDSLASTYVSQSTWAQRNETVNGRLDGLGREIGDLRRALDRKADAETIREALAELKQPARWPAVVAGVGVPITLVIALVTLLSR